MWLQLEANIYVHTLNSHKDMVEFICHFPRAVAKLPQSQEGENSSVKLNVPMNLVGSVSVRVRAWDSRKPTGEAYLMTVPGPLCLFSTPRRRRR